MDIVSALRRGVRDAGFGVEVEREPLPDVRHRHLVAGVMATLLAHRVRNDCVQRLALAVDADARACPARWRVRCRGRPRSRSSAAARAVARARPRACSRHATRPQPRAEPQLLEIQILAAERRPRARSGASSRLSCISTRKRSARSSSAVSARRGSARISESTAFRLLKRKCGRMRACSACSRAMVSAGDSRRLRMLK